MNDQIKAEKDSISIDEVAALTLVRIERENAINCTGLGEVGCYGRKGWHSWTEHREHVADQQVAALREAGLLVKEAPDA